METKTYQTIKPNCHVHGTEMKHITVLDEAYGGDVYVCLAASHRRRPMVVRRTGRDTTARREG